MCDKYLSFAYLYEKETQGIALYKLDRKLDIWIEED
jgi:hypothetical protein